VTTDDKPAPGPAGWSCSVCGLYPQVRGCAPGKCGGEATEPPAPFVCLSIADVTEAFSRLNGVPVAYVTEVPEVRVRLNSAVEMETLLRELQWKSCDNAGEPICYFCGVEASPLTGPKVGQAPIHLADCEIGNVLARIDAAKVPVGG
jgi:hypothetical protein